MTDIHEPIPGERGKTNFAQTSQRSLAFKRPALLLVGMLFLGFAFYSLKPTAKNEHETIQNEIIRQSTAFEPAREDIKPPDTSIKPEIVMPTPVALPQNVPEVDELLEAARRAPMMAYGGGRSGETTSSPTHGTEAFGTGPDLETAMTDRPSTQQQIFERALTPTLLQGSKAGHIGNRNFIIAKGTSIPCILETALSSDQPGFTSCVLNRDVLSDNGRVVLMEKGTQVTGEYRGGLARGQKRLFVLWNRAKTPQGVIITLASPATDALGRAGFDGFVNTHWWERFGSAFLLSVVNDATNYASTQLQRSQMQARETPGAGKEAAAIAVEQSIDIPPTLDKHHGSLVSIFIARDLDFTNIYELRVSEHRNIVYDRAVTGDFRPRSNMITK